MDAGVFAWPRDESIKETRWNTTTSSSCCLPRWTVNQNFVCPSHVFLWEERSSFTPPPTETSHLLTWWSERLYLHIHTSRSHQKENDVCRLPSFTTEMEIVFLAEWFSLLVSSRRWFCIMWHKFMFFFPFFFPVWSVTFLTAKVKQKLWGRVPEVIKPDDRITPISKIKVPALLEVSSWEL